MTSPFSAFSEFPDVKSKRPFSLPQQNYLLAQFLLSQCDNEARHRFEEDHPPEERERMGTVLSLECLDTYRDQLGYDEALDDWIETKNHLIEWGFEQLEQGPQTSEIRELLANKNRISRHSLLKDRFIGICMGMVPKEAEERRPLS